MGNIAKGEREMWCSQNEIQEDYHLTLTAPEAIIFRMNLQIIFNSAEIIL